jgi:excisionase family DNA binding protein
VLDKTHRGVHSVHVGDATQVGPPVMSMFMTVDDIANLLRTTRKAIYAMRDRGALPGITRIGRRLLFNRDAVLEWLRQKSNAIAEE